MKLDPDMDIHLIMSAIARLRTPVEIVDALTVALQHERGFILNIRGHAAREA